MNALYIGTIVITAKRNSKDIRTISRENCPMVLDENFRIPEESLMYTITSIVTKPIAPGAKPYIEYKKVSEYTYTYVITYYKFSSNVYSKK
jgi:hypothetical protein